MISNVKNEATAAVSGVPPLVKALSKSEQVKGKVEECAQELASVNEVLKKEVTGHLPLQQVEKALYQSEEVEFKVQECADDLSLVNRTLAGEIRERKALEQELAKNQVELADSQAELSHTQDREKRARHLSLHDVVTGLPNRRLFNDRLEIALAQAKRHQRRLAVMFIDLNKFKGVNDSHGHDAGDKVLKIVSERLQASVRGDDTVGRRGGDEFVYLMLEVKNPSDVEHAAGKLLDRIGQSCEFDGLTLSVNASIGIALYPQDGESADALLRNADSAMYEAKQSNSGYRFAVSGKGSPASTVTTATPVGPSDPKGQESGTRR
jgi:diguanylate cyclase (GGDEF)-like protein